MLATTRIVLCFETISSFQDSIAFNGLYCFDFAKDVRGGGRQFLYPFGFVVTAVIKWVTQFGGRISIEKRRGSKIATLSFFVNLSFQIGNNFNRGSCHCVLCFWVILKYTRGRLCQRGIRLFRTRVAGPTNPITRNADNRGISNRLIVRFWLPLLQTFLYLFQRPTIRVRFTEMQESIPAQFPVNR